MQVGEQRDFGFEVKDHTTLGEALGILDFDSGGVVSGSKFYYLKGAAALLELALVNWTMSKVRGRLARLPLAKHSSGKQCWVHISCMEPEQRHSGASSTEIARAWQIVAKGFDPMITPDLIRESVLEKCGFQPRMENTQVRGACH